MGPRKLTVIQTLPALDAGGVERGTLEVAAELVRRGHRSIVVSAGGKLLEELLAGGSEHINLPIGKKSLMTLRHVRSLRRILDDANADILHARSRLPAWICYLAWHRMDTANRPRFITSVHGHYSVNRYSRIMTAGERVIAISSSIHEYIIRNYPDVPPQKITVIPRGVNSNAYPYGFQPSASWLQRWNEQYPQLRGKTLITLPGRITRLKGHEDFLAVISRVADHCPAVHGLIVGGSHPGKQAYFRELESTVMDNGLQDRITFTGNRHDVREIMSISSIIMSLSKAPEAFGRTVLESLCLGVPVIAYDHGGAGEILRTMFPAGLVTRNDIHDTAEKAIDFIETSPTVPDNNPYTLQHMLELTMKLYENVSASTETGQAGNSGQD